MRAKSKKNQKPKGNWWTIDMERKARIKAFWFKVGRATRVVFDAGTRTPVECIRKAAG